MGSRAILEQGKLRASQKNIRQVGEADMPREICISMRMTDG